MLWLLGSPIALDLAYYGADQINSPLSVSSAKEQALYRPHLYCRPIAYGW